MPKFRLISLLAVVTAVCIGAFLLRPAKHPPEVQEILAKAPSVLGSSYTEALAVLFDEKPPVLNDYYGDYHCKDNRCSMVDIVIGYRFVYFLNKNKIEHLSVEWWDEKENQWTSISKDLTDSSIPPWWDLPENVWIREQAHKPPEEWMAWPFEGHTPLGPIGGGG